MKIQKELYFKLNEPNVFDDEENNTWQFIAIARLAKDSFLFILT